MPTLCKVFKHDSGFFYTVSDFNDGVNITNQDYFSVNNYFSKLSNPLEITEYFPSFKNGIFRKNNGKLLFNNGYIEFEKITDDEIIKMIVVEEGNLIYRDKVKKKNRFSVWKSAYPGPYTTLCIGGLNEYENPLEDLDCVYSNNMFIETYPMHLDVVVPNSKLEEVETVANARKLSYKIH